MGCGTPGGRTVERAEVSAGHREAATAGESRRGDPSVPVTSRGHGRSLPFTLGSALQKVEHRRGRCGPRANKVLVPLKGLESGCGNPGGCVQTSLTCRRRDFGAKDTDSWKVKL